MDSRLVCCVLVVCLLCLVGAWLLCACRVSLGRGVCLFVFVVRVFVVFPCVLVVCLLCMVGAWLCRCCGVFAVCCVCWECVLVSMKVLCLSFHVCFCLCLFMLCVCYGGESAKKSAKKIIL